MTTLQPDWYTTSEGGCIIRPTLRGAIEIAALKLISNDEASNQQS